MENQDPKKLLNLDESQIREDKTEVLLEESKVNPLPSSIIGKKLKEDDYIFPHIILFRKTLSKATCLVLREN